MKIYIQSPLFNRSVERKSVANTPNTTYRERFRQQHNASIQARSRLGPRKARQEYQSLNNTLETGYEKLKTRGFSISVNDVSGG